MSAVPAVLASLLGAVLTLAGTALYLRDVRCGSTRPHRGSWLVWGVVGVLAAASHGAAGGSWSLLVLTGQALTTLAVLAVSVRHGVGSVTPANVAMLAVAGLGVAGWLTLADPVAAAGCAAVADGAGLVAIVPKAWADPDSETAGTYALAGVTGLLALLAVDGLRAELVLFPAYYCAGNAAAATLIAVRRNRLRRKAFCRVAAAVGRVGSGSAAGQVEESQLRVGVGG